VLKAIYELEKISKNDKSSEESNELKKNILDDNKNEMEALKILKSGKCENPEV